MNSNWQEMGYHQLILSGQQNIYRPDTLEGILVNSVIEFYKKLENGLFAISSDKNLTEIILRQIKEAKLVVHLDTHYIYYLSKKAIWHARVSGILDIKPIKRNKNHEEKIFGLYLESGLNDLWYDSYSLTNLELKSPNEKYKNHLLTVAEVFSKFKKEYNIPTLSYGANTIAISNIDDHHYIYNEQYLQFPNHTWAYANEQDVAADTRGSFHHLGDDFAFMLAAKLFGKVYIVGNDEFGDMQVINALGYRNYKVLNVKDFDYIYGVPRSKCQLPTAKNNIFTYSDDNRDHNLAQTKEIAGLSNRYWQNPVFLKYADRKIEETTLQELAIEFKQCVEKSLPEEFSKIFTMSTENLMMEFFPENLNPNNKLLVQANKTIEKDFSFFVKTIAHKVDCTVVNPSNQTSGFFKKANTLKEQAEEFEEEKLNLSLVLKLIKSHIQSMLGVENYLFLYQKEINGAFAKLWDNLSFWQKVIAFKLTNQPFFVDNKCCNLFFYSDESSQHLYNFWEDSYFKTLVKSELVPMQYEYRMVIINHRVVTTSPCFRNTTPFNTWNGGIFDPRLADGHNAYDTFENEESRHIVASYAWFSRKFTKEIKEKYPQYKNYVLDVCCSKIEKTDEKIAKYKVLPIEINSINFFGAYQIDFRKVCAALAGKPVHQQYINSLGLDYQEYLKNNLLQKQIDNVIDVIKELNQPLTKEETIEISINESIIKETDNFSEEGKLII